MNNTVVNIENLVKIFKDKFPDKNIIVAPDNDKKITNVRSPSRSMQPHLGHLSGRDVTHPTKTRR